LFKVANCDLEANLLIRQLKQKICGKAFGISADLLVQSLGRNSIELGELRIEQHALPADMKNLNRRNTRELCGRFGHTRMIMLSPARESYE